MHVQDVDNAAARFTQEQPEVGQITAEAFKVKIIDQGGEAVVIKLSDPSQGAPPCREENAPITAVEEACRRSAARSSSTILICDTHEANQAESALWFQREHAALDFALVCHALNSI